ncbi:MAG: hypothetical protein ACYDCK_03930, partial [Thermoplasmatota archaeon]
MTVSFLALLVFLHILGASLWVGGQIALAGIVGVLRRALPETSRRETLRAVANGAQPILWSGLVLAALSGLVLLSQEGR